MADRVLGAREQLGDVLGLIDAGELEATPAQRAYICGARDALESLPGDAKASGPAE